MSEEEVLDDFINNQAEELFVDEDSLKSVCEKYYILKLNK